MRLKISSLFGGVAAWGELVLENHLQAFFCAVDKKTAALFGAAVGECNMLILLDVLFGSRLVYIGHRQSHRRL